MALVLGGNKPLHAMSVKPLLALLYASLFGVLFVLALVMGYTLSLDETTSARHEIDVVDTAAPEPVFFPEYKLGKVLWNKHACGSCHNKNMKDKSTAPALGGVAARWAAYPREDLHARIRNSQRLVIEGYPRANELWKEWRPNVMSMYSLEDKGIEALLNYIETEYVGQP